MSIQHKNVRRDQVFAWSRKRLEHLGDAIGTLRLDHVYFLQSDDIQLVDASGGALPEAPAPDDQITSLHIVGWVPRESFCFFFKGQGFELTIRFKDSQTADLELRPVGEPHGMATDITTLETQFGSSGWTVVV